MPTVLIDSGTAWGGASNAKVKAIVVIMGKGFLREQVVSSSNTRKGVHRFAILRRTCGSMCGKLRGAARCVLVDPYDEFVAQARFASRQFGVDSCEYLHEWRSDGYSDHSPLLAELRYAAG